MKTLQELSELLSDKLPSLGDSESAYRKQNKIIRDFIKEYFGDYEYLEWFRINVDFGPADGDMRHWLNEKFEQETKKEVPADWKD